MCENFAGNRNSDVDRYISRNHEHKIVNRFEVLRHERTLCDVCLLIDDKEIHAHRVVLAACSDYFSAMFTTALIECKTKDIRLHNVDYPSCAALIDYCYTGRIELCIGSVEDILNTASMLQLLEVVAACENFIVKRLNISNCVGIRSFAHRLNCSDLFKSADNYLLENFLSVTNETEFSDLDIDDLKVILTKDKLNVRKEIQVFESAIKWIEKQPDIRMEHSAALLECVRLQYLPMNQLKQIENHEYIRGNGDCTKVLLNTVFDRYITLEDSTTGGSGGGSGGSGGATSSDITKTSSSVAGVTQPSLAHDLVIMSSSSTIVEEEAAAAPSTDSGGGGGAKTYRRWCEPRKSTQGKLYIIGGIGFTPYPSLVCMEFYDPRTCIWNPVPIDGLFSLNFHALSNTLNVPLICKNGQQYAVAAVGHKIYIIGGRDGLKTLSGMECLDIRTMKWTREQDLQRQRHGLGVVVLNDYLYAVGGHDGWLYLNCVERYSMKTKQWSPVHALIHARASLAVTSLNGYIYAIGGKYRTQSLDVVERYDPEVDRWTEMSCMLHKRGGIGVTTCKGFIYTIGGHLIPNDRNPTLFDTVERYCPLTDQWSDMAPINSPREIVTAITFTNRIYAIGGNVGKFLKVVESYDPDTNEWRQESSLNICRAGACIVNIPC